MKQIIGVLSVSGKDVARFPLSARKLVLFETGPDTPYKQVQTLEVPEDDVPGFIASKCETLLVNLGNEEFLLDILAFGVDVFCTRERSAEAAVLEHLSGRNTKLSGGCSCCGG